MPIIIVINDLITCPHLSLLIECNLFLLLFTIEVLLPPSPTDNTDPIAVCQVLREQNEALRQELHDIRRVRISIRRTIEMIDSLGNG